MSEPTHTPDIEWVSGRPLTAADVEAIVEHWNQRFQPQDPAAAEIRELRRFLEALVAEGPPITYGYDGDPECAYCRSGEWEANTIVHEPDCPWRLAREHLGDVPPAPPA